MTRRKEKGPPARGITPVYEGPEVLAVLLERAGSPFDVEEVSSRFAAAIAADEPRAACVATTPPMRPLNASGPSCFIKLSGS